ncbi:hypothetical protein [Streptomyces katsurahamanus]|uniref:Uncharacterized protein n=1 Tax=Streptomyces katsurahamanus TaxID=2577098 RepID=A0ABW9NRR2_9ACTN|nr:hypothetical protein [Streptomyces katsurahamanus]MQS36000.1 hypothetical protein [Streptomyces katsurahamanus]
MGVPRVPRARAIARSLVTLFAGAGLMLSLPGTARAAADPAEPPPVSYHIPAEREGGVSITVSYYGAVLPRPYNPDPKAYFGDRKCLNTYHDYTPTPGCGGFRMLVELHNVRNQPGFELPNPEERSIGASGYDRVNHFVARADVSRSYGCVRSDGTYDPYIKFTLRERMFFDDDPVQTDISYILARLRESPTGSSKPYLYVNFKPVEVGCPPGMTPAQQSLKVSDLHVSVNAYEVFGIANWRHPAPFEA